MPDGTPIEAGSGTGRIEACVLGCAKAISVRESAFILVRRGRRRGMPMSLELKEIHLAHELDASWMIALWIAIHGGDPPPIEGLVSRELQEGAALGAIEALSAALDEKTREAVHHAIAPTLHRSRMKTVDPEVERGRLAGLGIRVKQYATEREHTQAHAFASDASNHDRVQRPPYCVRFRGVSYCIYLPTVDPIPFD